MAAGGFHGRWVSSLHHLGDKTDDGGGRLVRIQLCKQVADVVGGAALLPRHKPKQLYRRSHFLAPLPVLGVDVTEGDSVDGVVPSEEDLSLTVSEGDTL